MGLWRGATVAEMRGNGTGQEVVSEMIESTGHPQSPAWFLHPSADPLCIVSCCLQGPQSITSLLLPLCLSLTKNTHPGEAKSQAAAQHTQRKVFIQPPAFTVQPRVSRAPALPCTGRNTVSPGKQGEGDADLTFFLRQQAVFNFAERKRKQNHYPKHVQP